ncbi:MAG: rhamnogalacturonan acetylesterase [Verrucomicrobia bacterium]|nr:rhamnogalacturonan acetylesterase [Verrucomicrobiota bacterium]
MKIVLKIALLISLAVCEAKVKAVTIGLIGDSTVAVQSGWGPAFAGRFEARVKIVNYAKNGATLQALSKKLDELVQLQPDYVLIQFGHNDQKRYDTQAYKAYLQSYVDRIKKGGGEPIIVSSVTRRSFDKNGRIVSNLVQNEKYSYKATLTDYAKAAEALAKELNLSFIDLHTASIAHHNKIGREESMAYNFKEGDKTHFNRKGAETITDLIIEELKTTVPELAVYLRAGKPADPIPAESVKSKFDLIRKAHIGNAEKFFENVLRKQNIIPLHGAFARLWLNREMPEANRLLRQAEQGIIKHEKGQGGMTVEIASSEHVKWQMRTWNRVYQLFHDKSRFYPGRLDAETQAVVERMFWLYVIKMSRFERAGLDHVWSIHGSENHEMMHYSNALLALQALKNSPEYKNRILPDGRSVKAHYEAWNTYYKEYCVSRAKHGLLVEVFSQYGPSYTLPEMMNMRDLSEDEVLRERMDKILHLIWADWAVGQIRGVRGGGRTRIYQDDSKSKGRLTGWGSGDRWRNMGQSFLGTREWWGPRQVPNHPIQGTTFVLATTGYRLPDVIMDIAQDVEGRGEYTYVARRIAKQKHMKAKDIPVKHSPWYAFEPTDPRMIGYDYCTPDYVMGSLMIDPKLPRVSSHLYQEGQDLPEGYPALTSQNRYHGIVFASDLNARVVPQCEGLANGKTYGEQQAVQHENVLLVQRHAKAKTTGDMRVIWGGKGMKTRIVERSGWQILREGNAWLGVKGFSRTKSNASCGSSWDNEVILRMNDGKAPVALIAGRSEDHADIEAFANYLGTFSGEPRDGWFKLSGGKDEKLTLSLHLSSEGIPRVNGTSINLAPKKLFDSPFIQSKHGSGIVNIRKGQRRLTIDLGSTGSER